jgi:Flp pilus assembly protein TadD
LLEKALELNPKSLSAHTFLALYWERQNRYDFALQYLRSATKLDDRNPVLQAELARLLAVSGNLNEAYKVYSLAASLSPFDPTYQSNQVEFSMRYDYLIEEIALPTARQLVIQYPDQTVYLDLMAQVLIHQGDLMTAERFLKRTLEIDTGYAPARLHLGLVYILQENFEAGNRELNQAISLSENTSISVQAQRLLDTYFP